ncbi:MAG: ABC transporter permease [Duodenibacillus sp.]|nr:ABC transporter permease [Duodenibacillus sp.]
MKTAPKPALAAAAWLALVRKELRATLKERTSRMILVGPLVLYIILFGYIATFNLNHVPYALCSLDRGEAAAELVRALDAAPVFERVATLRSTAEITAAIDKGDALMAVVIPQGYGKAIEEGRAEVEAVIDGRNSTTASLAAGYLTTIAQGVAERRLGAPQLLSVRFLYNPNNITQWFIMPGLIMMLSMLQVMMLSALSVAREREQGTFEQLLVTPYSTLELLLAKAFVPLLIGLAQASAIFAADVLWFRIPFAGSAAALYGVLAVFVATVVGLGLCISAASKSMQQSLILVFALLVPMVLLSGMFSPVQNMPEAVRALTWLDPLRFGLLAIRRVYLAGAGWGEAARILLPDFCMMAVTLPMAYRFFKKRL